MLGGLRTVRGSGISVGISQGYLKAEHMSRVNQTWDGSGKLGLFLSEGHHFATHPVLPQWGKARSWSVS